MTIPLTFALISTSGETLPDCSTGESVRAGQTLAVLYSPELFTAQQELLEAIKMKLGHDDSAYVRFDLDEWGNATGLFDRFYLGVRHFPRM